MDCKTSISILTVYFVLKNAKEILTNSADYNRK